MDSLRHQEATPATVEGPFMNVTCETLDSLLLEGDAFSMQVAAQHASDCDVCRERLASWNEISDTAHGMRATWSSDTLWPRIDRAVQQQSRRPAMRLWQIAAAFVLLAGMAGLIWFAQQRIHNAAFDKVILRASALDQVDQAEKAHLAAIDHLERVAAPKLDDPSDPLLVNYKEKLLLLDAAIAECQTAIDRNRQNAHLRRQLLAIYSEKQRTLQDVLQEKSHEASQ